MTPPKNRDRDAAVGQALQHWLDTRNLSHGAFAKMIHAATPCVQNWCTNGTRPNRRHWEALSNVTGWDWTNLDYIATTYLETGSVPSPPIVRKKKQKRSESFDSIEGLEVARLCVQEAITTGKPLPANVLLVVSDALSAEVVRREQNDPKYKTLAGIRELILSHPDPAAALALYREHAHVNRDILNAIERTLYLNVAATA